MNHRLIVVKIWVVFLSCQAFLHIFALSGGNPDGLFFNTFTKILTIFVI